MRVEGPWANNDYNGQLGDDWSASPENHLPGRWLLLFVRCYFCSCFLSSIRDFTPLSGSSDAYATAFQGF